MLVTVFSSELYRFFFFFQFMALLGLCCGAWALRCGVRALVAVSRLFLAAVSPGCYLAPVGELLGAVASPVFEHSLHTLQ